MAKGSWGGFSCSRDRNGHVNWCAKGNWEKGPCHREMGKQTVEGRGRGAPGGKVESTGVQGKWQLKWPNSNFAIIESKSVDVLSNRRQLKKKGTHENIGSIRLAF